MFQIFTLVLINPDLSLTSLDRSSHHSWYFFTADREAEGVGREKCRGKNNV